MNPLVREAIDITKDIGDVIFIGAVAIMLHTKMGRPSADLDIVLATELSDEDLAEKKYIKLADKRDSWQTPRLFKVDIFRKDVSKIPIKSVIDTSKIIQVDSHNTLRVASLECLIVAKNRAKRPQDLEDLRLLAKKKFNEIEWDVLKSISKTEMEFNGIKSTMTFYRDQ